jgi:hypothetical protein
MVEGVEFDEEKKTYARPPGAPVSFSGGNSFNEHPYSPNGSEPKMIQWLLRHGYAKTPAVGNVILLIVVVLNILIAYFVFKNFV